MKTIEDEATFLEVLELSRAIVFCHADWSGPSYQRLKSLRAEASQLSRPEIPIFIAAPYYQNFVDAWLQKYDLGNLKNIGAGEALFLERGRIVAKVSFDASVAAINETVAKIWK